jgi:hypothetical protein
MDKATQGWKKWPSWITAFVLSGAVFANDALAAAERHVWAKVLVHGVATSGPGRGYNYTRFVYLDAVTVPAGTVVQDDSGIIFTDGKHPKQLSELHTRALEFVKPHVESLGIEKVQDYEVSLYTESADAADLAALQKQRADRFASRAAPGVGPSAELHGVWAGKAAAGGNKSPLVQKAANKSQGPALVLTSKSTAADDAAKAKAAAEQKKKADEDHKKGLAIAKKKADEEKAKADKEAKRKAEGRLVTQVQYSDGLTEQQAATWCQRKKAELSKNPKPGGNPVISTGNCSCKPGGNGVSFQKEFRCEIPVTFREFTSSMK